MVMGRPDYPTPHYPDLHKAQPLVQHAPLNEAEDPRESAHRHAGHPVPSVLP